MNLKWGKLGEELLKLCYWVKKLTPRFSNDVFKSATTSSPTTPSQLNPFVHRIKIPFVRPICFRGKEKVNPRGSLSDCNLCSWKVLWKNQPVNNKKCQLFPWMSFCGFLMNFGKELLGIVSHKYFNLIYVFVSFLEQINDR